MHNAKEILLSNKAGRSFWVLGDRYTFKVTGEQTNGACTVIDQVIQPGGGPPPHIHHREDEAFYVLEGTFAFRCGDREHILDTGSFAYIPKGTLHTFKNITTQPGRLLVTITPQAWKNSFIPSAHMPATQPPHPPLIPV